MTQAESGREDREAAVSVAGYRSSETKGPRRSVVVAAWPDVIGFGDERLITRDKFAAAVRQL